MVGAIVISIYCSWDNWVLEKLPLSQIPQTQELCFIHKGSTLQESSQRFDLQVDLKQSRIIFADINPHLPFLLCYTCSMISWEDLMQIRGLKAGSPSG